MHDRNMAIWILWNIDILRSFNSHDLSKKEIRKTGYDKLQTRSHTIITNHQFWAVSQSGGRDRPRNVQLWAIFGRPFVKQFALCHQTIVCLSGVLWPNGWMDPNEIWHAGRPRPWPHCVWWEPPQFSAHICCGQMAGLIKTPLGTEVGLSPGDLMLDRDPAPPP